MNRESNVFFPLLEETDENDASAVPEEPSLFSYDLEEPKINDHSSRNNSKWKTTEERTRLTCTQDLHLFPLDSHNCLVCLKDSQLVGIKGKGYMKVLGGKVCIHGNTWGAQNGWTYLGVSAWDPLLLVDSDNIEEYGGITRHSSDDESLQGLSWLEDVFRQDPYLSPFTSQLRVDSIPVDSPVKAVVAFRSCIKEYHWESLVSSQENNFVKLVDGMYLCRNRDLEQVAHFRVWDGWKELAMNIDSSCVSMNENFRVFLVCGDRGAGKSTVVRSLCNRLLTHHRCVWLMDTDLGQTERMPPGTVSLTEIKSFFHSTPLTHETYDSTISYFIGVVTPRERPHIYKEAVQRLATEMYSRASRSGEPCVINTHGWTSGLGLTILQFLFQLLHPTDVVQVETKDHVSKLSDRWFDSCLFNDSHDSVRRWKLIRYPLSSSSGGDKLSSSEKRHLQLLVYFCPQAGFFLSPPSSALSQTIAYAIGNQFAQLPVFQVLLKDMQIYSIDGVVDMEHIDALLLGAVVGLCWNVEQSNCLKDSEPFRCFGLGLVKAMEIDKTILYISTPVYENKLKMVNTLVVSRFIQLPPAAYLWTGPIEPHFVSWDGLSYASSEMRSRNNIPRRRLMNKKDN